MKTQLPVEYLGRATVPDPKEFIRSVYDKGIARVDAEFFVPQAVRAISVDDVVREYRDLYKSGARPVENIAARLPPSPFPLATLAIIATAGYTDAILAQKARSQNKPASMLTEYCETNREAIDAVVSNLYEVLGMTRRKAATTVDAKSTAPKRTRNEEWMKRRG